VLEASVAIRVGDTSDATGPPERIIFHHNYLENRLTTGSTALRLERGRDVHFYNNVVDDYATPFWVASAGVERAAIANNLVLQPQVAFSLLSTDSVAFFDYNIFGAPASLRGLVGSDSVNAAEWIARRMPHSRIVSGVTLSGGDLGQITGFSPVDAGKAVEGISYRGAAPDIGVAER
jgi:hypothetical protein